GPAAIAKSTRFCWAWAWAWAEGAATATMPAAAMNHAMPPPWYLAIHAVLFVPDASRSPGGLARAGRGSLAPRADLDPVRLDHHRHAQQRVDVVGKTLGLVNTILSHDFPG